MSSACGIRLVESQARAYYVTQFTYKSEKSTDLNYTISRVVSSLHYFVLLQKTKTLSLALPTSNSSLYWTQELKTARHLVRSDFFCKDLRKTLKYVDEFPE